MMACQTMIMDLETDGKTNIILLAMVGLETFASLLVMFAVLDELIFGLDDGAEIIVVVARVSVNGAGTRSEFDVERPLLKFRGSFALECSSRTSQQVR